MNFLVQPLLLATLVREGQCNCPPDSICDWMWRICFRNDDCDTDANC